jgi:hypothetical protein
VDQNNNHTLGFIDSITPDGKSIIISRAADGVKVSTQNSDRILCLIAGAIIGSVLSPPLVINVNVFEGPTVVIQQQIIDTSVDGKMYAAKYEGTTEAWVGILAHATS